MTIEAKIQDLMDQICHLDRFDREAILAIIRDHAALVPAGPRILIVLAPVQQGHVSIRSVRALAAEWGVPPRAVVEGIQIQMRRLNDRRLCQTKPIPDSRRELVMSTMQNVGTAEDPRWVIAIPQEMAWMLL